MPNVQTAAREMAEMSTATISDAFFRMGHKDRTMHSRIKPVDPGMKVAGPALTVKAYPGATHACDLAIQAVEEGQVIVVDGGAFLEAVLWGEIFSMMGMAKGAAGTVIDGAVRDVDDVIELGYPLFSAGITPAAGTVDKLGEINVPVSCGGVVVKPGDWVYGDRLGVVVAQPDRIVELRQWCDDVLTKEAKMIEGLRAQCEARQR